MRGMFPHLGASVPTVERATAASPPLESGFLTPVEKLPKEPISKEAPPPPGLPQLSEIDKFNLLRASLLGKQPEEDKPKVKEAETIKVPDFPNPETYRSWKTAAREAIRAASDQPDAAFTWVLEAYKKDVSHEKLRDPGKFLTLDTKLLASLSKVAKGELARQILNFKEVEAGFERAVRGRQILYLFDQHFKTNEEVGSLYSVEDLLKVTLVQDDLSTFLHNWESVIAGMSHIPDEVTLRDILLRQIRKSQRLKFDLERYDRAKEGTPEHSYEFLKESIRDLLTRERMRKNRDRIAKSHGDKYGAPLRKGPDAPLGGKADEGEDPQAHLDPLDQGPLVGAPLDNQVMRSKFAEIFSRANASEGMNVNFCTGPVRSLLILPRRRSKLPVTFGS